jgi:hypothetical protein
VENITVVTNLGSSNQTFKNDLSPFSPFPVSFFILPSSSPPPPILDMCPLWQIYRICTPALRTFTQTLLVCTHIVNLLIYLTHVGLQTFFLWNNMYKFPLCVVLQFPRQATYSPPPQLMRPAKNAQNSAALFTNTCARAHMLPLLGHAADTCPISRHRTRVVT